jgi:biopolymer transport protein ExbB
MVGLEQLQMLKQGGWVMLPLAGFLFTASSLGLQKWVFYTWLLPLKNAPFEALQNQLLKVETFSALKQAQPCRPPNSMFEDILEHALANQHAVFGVFQATLESCAQKWMQKGHRSLRAFEFFITAAPLLGLLGTIFGMMDAFKVLDHQQFASMGLSSGIAEALIATAAGLVVALFNLGLHSYFSAKLDQMTQMLEWITTWCERTYLNSGHVGQNQDALSQPKLADSCTRPETFVQVSTKSQ